MHIHFKKFEIYSMSPCARTWTQSTSRVPPPFPIFPGQSPGQIKNYAYYTYRWTCPWILVNKILPLACGLCYPAFRGYEVIPYLKHTYVPRPTVRTKNMVYVDHRVLWGKQHLKMIKSFKKECKISIEYWIYTHL